MATFVFAYRSPKGYVPGSPETRAAWTTWFESMGSHVADIGQPVSDRSTLGNIGSETDLGGYSIITADDLESAVTMAKGCPHLSRGGGIEVGQLAEIG